MKIFSQILLLIFTFTNIAFSQSSSFQQFKTSDGLPSPNVYDCIQDSEGYMWFATDYGVSRFDSYSFQNFSTNDGLNSNFITGLIEKENQIYIGSQSGGVNIYNDNKIRSLNFNEDPRQWITNMVLYKGKIYESYSTRISVLDNDSSSLIFSNEFFPYLNITMYRVYWMHSINNERLLAVTTDGIYEIKENNFERLKVENFQNQTLYGITSDKKNNVYVSGDNVIYKIADNKIIETYKFKFGKEQKIFRILVDQNGLIWFSVLNEGLFLFNPVTNHLTDLNKKLDSEKLHVNSIYMDNKDNVWVSTYGKGVYCFYNTFINNYDTKDGMNNSKINSISGDKDNRIYCATFNGLAILENDSITNVKTKGQITLTDYISRIRKENDSLFVLNYINDSKNVFFVKYKNINLVYSPARASMFINKDSLIIGGWNNYLRKSTAFKNENKLSKSDYIYVIGDTLVNNKINEIAKGKNGKILIASELGICVLQDNKAKVIKGDKLNSSFSKIKADDNGYVWACGERGLFIIKDSIVVYEYSIAGQEKVSAFEFNNEGFVWLSTMKGIHGMSVKYEDGKIDLKEEYLINENAGLISNDISSMYYDKTFNKLWAGTSEGLASIDLNSFNNQLDHTLPLRILNIRTPDSVYNITRNISFPEYVKDIRISVTSFDINSAGNLEYFYKLNDQDTIWNKTNDNVITFPSLAYGNYNFQIYAANTFGKRSEASLLNFTVETPFTKSFIFYALISLSAMSLTGYTVSRSFKKKYLIEKERNTFKNQISDLKQRSLVSMMNPHFVFNSLNSIQSFYNYKENESANEYLAKFSRLIRMNLDFADKTFIRLSDEIERLESYLLLEKMRFNDNLNYEIWVSDDIDPEKTKIPNMIIQPFVENAIWHGILKSQLAGEVKVNIFHSQLPEDIRKNYQIQVHSSLKGSKTDPIDPNPAHCIKIEIIDNGAGINNSRKNRSSGHVSRGISVIKERLSILHHYTGDTELVKITDRSELPESQSGTIVEIYLTPNIFKVN